MRNACVALLLGLIAVERYRQGVQEAAMRGRPMRYAFKGLNQPGSSADHGAGEERTRRASDDAKYALTKGALAIG